MAVSAEVITSPLQQMAATTATDYWNDSSSVEELTYAVARGATGATSNPTIVGEVLRKELHLWRDRIAELVAGNPTWTEDEITWKLIEEISVRRLGDPAAGVRARGPAEGAPVDPDESEVLPRPGADPRAGRPLLRARAEHAGEGARHEGGDPGGGGRDGRRRRDQRDGELHRSAGHRGRRGRRARTRAARGRGGGRLADDAGRDDDDRPARRLDRGARPARPHARRPGLPALGRDRVLQARLPHLPGARLPRSAARRGLPAPAPLDGARRRRRRADHAARVAAALQRVRSRGRPPDGRAGSRAASSPSCASGSPTSAAPTTPTG